jgi:hypothetical protein
LDSTANQVFSIAGIINIIIEGRKERVVYGDNYQFQNRKEKQQLTATIRRYHKVPSLNTNKSRI